MPGTEHVWEMDDSVDLEQLARETQQHRHRTVHTAAWFSIESCVDRRATAAAAVVGGECLLVAAGEFTAR
jgi:hypothetical protein